MIQRHPVFFQPIGRYDSNILVTFRNFNHHRQAVREQPVIRMYKLDVSALCIDIPEGSIPVLHWSDMVIQANRRYSAIAAGRSLCNFPRSVGTAVIYNNVFEILERLLNDALNTFVQKFFAVVDRRDDAYQVVMLNHSRATPANSIYFDWR